MNHIEEMMKTARVKEVTIIGCGEVYRERGIDIWKTHCRDYVKTHPNCEDCPKNCVTRKIPDFTAEKQLEIIKLIIETEGFCGFTNFRDNDKYSISCGFNFPVGPNPARGINFHPTFRECGTLEQALAQLTTELMTAGELDKEKVKEILEK